MAESRKYISSAFWLGALLLSVHLALGQAAPGAPLTVCQLLASPALYSGKLVTVRAEVISPRRVQLVDPTEANCGKIPWAFPKERDLKPKPKFSLVRDQKYEELLDSFGLMIPPPPGSKRKIQRILATLEGRFDSVYRAKHGRPYQSRSGIGYLGADEQVFVLHRVLTVEIW